MNRITLIGNITKTPETKTFQSGSVTSFTVATSEKWTDKASGEKKEKTQFHNCNAWNKTGEVIAKYHDRGDRICVVGAVEYEVSEKDGKKTYFTKIKVKEFEFVKNSGSSNTNQAQQEQLPSRDINSDVNDQPELPF